MNLKTTLLTDKNLAEQFRKALPRHLSQERFIRVAATQLSRVPRLAECEPVSFFRCLLELSALGLEPDGRCAHLIPFRNGKTNQTECQLIVDYKGLCDLVRRSGEVHRMHCDLVCERDAFKRGVNAEGPFLEWQPANTDRGDVIGAFSLVVMKDGGVEWEYMTKDEIDAIRKRSKAANAGPWVTDWSEMARKTVFRRHSKRLPFSVEIRKAIEADDSQYFDMRTGSIDIETEEEPIERKPGIPKQQPALEEPKEKIPTIPPRKQQPEKVPSKQSSPSVSVVPQTAASDSEDTPDLEWDASDVSVFDQITQQQQRLGWTVQQVESLAVAEAIAEDDEKLPMYSQQQQKNLLEVLKLT